jgi:hypothetical protein
MLTVERKFELYTPQGHGRRENRQCCFFFPAEMDGCFCPVLHFWFPIAFLNFPPLSLVWLEWHFSHPTLEFH